MDDSSGNGGGDDGDSVVPSFIFFNWFVFYKYFTTFWLWLVFDLNKSCEIRLGLNLFMPIQWNKVIKQMWSQSKTFVFNILVEDKYGMWMGSHDVDEWGGKKIHKHTHRLTVAFTALSA